MTTENRPVEQEYAYDM